MAYRNDLEALSARHDALSVELAAKTKEVNEAARLLEEARTRAKLPVLDNIRVASPCPADWNQMTGDERVRHCADCKKHVYNLSDLTREEAQALIIEKNGKLCVRYYQRHDGTILLKDCSIGIAKKRKRQIIAVGALALLGGTALFALSRKGLEGESCGALTLEAHEPIEPTYATTGVVEAPPPAPTPREKPRTKPPENPEYQIFLGDWAGHGDASEITGNL